MEKIKSSKGIALGATALFVASLFWLLDVKRVNTSLEAEWKKERLKSEQLLSEKLQLDKDIQKFKDQLVALKAENLNLDNLLERVNAKLRGQEADYNRMKKQNIGLAQIKAQKEELLKLHNDLQDELQSIRNSYATLQSENSRLHATIASLEERNKLLRDDLDQVMLASIDQSQIEAVKGKADKLTIRAKRTRKLIATFQVPSNLRNLSFRIIDANGNTLSSQHGVIASTVLASEESLTASSDPEVTPASLQHVQMTFLPKGKLKTGVYTVEVLNDNLYVSSMKVKLR